MRVVPWEDLSGLVSYRDRPSALTVGVFDGVHRGHRAIIGKITGTRDDLIPVVVTFSRLPHNVLDPASKRKILITPERKLTVLDGLGVVVAVMIDFSQEFSKMTAESFFKTLSGAFLVRKVVEGENFHFGHDRAAGRKALAGFCDKIGASLETADTVLFKDLPVSSTRIRHAVQAGLMGDVAYMLGGPYPLDLPVSSWERDTDGRLVVDRRRLEQAVPEKGTYHCRTESGAAVDMKIEKGRCFIRTNLPSIKTLYFEEKNKPD